MLLLPVFQIFISWTNSIFGHSRTLLKLLVILLGLVVYSIVSYYMHSIVQLEYYRSCNANMFMTVFLKNRYHRVVDTALPSSLTVSLSRAAVTASSCGGSSCSSRQSSTS